MTTILALDSSSENCSVALMLADKLFVESRLAPRKHTQLILPMIQDILQQQNISVKHLGALAFGCGPGSFTGIRIAAGVAQGLAFGLDVPIYAISNLQALALQSYLENGVSTVFACIDARMDEVYWGVFQISRRALETDGLKYYFVEPLIEQQVCAPEVLNFDAAQADISDLAAIGSGLQFRSRFPASVQVCLMSENGLAQPNADTIALLAQSAMASSIPGRIEDALPAYVRENVTWNKLPGRE